MFLFRMSCSSILGALADGMKIPCTVNCWEVLNDAVKLCHIAEMAGMEQQCKSLLPTRPPTESPTEVPSHAPSHTPTETPTTHSPSPSPSHTPTEHPTFTPTATPTEEPTDEPTREPTNEPTDDPTRFPTEVPTSAPTHKPTHGPTEVPTVDPTELPTQEPTNDPTEVPTTLPPTTDEPSLAPTITPTEEPTRNPTSTPTEPPTALPSHAPTDEPTAVPTESPTEPLCKDVLKSDLILAIDSSDSISDSQWTQFMNFVDKLVKDFPISADGMNVGALQFASTAHTYSTLTSPYAKTGMLPRGKDTQLGFRTNMDKAVELAIKNFENGRADAADILIVISDGLPSDGTNNGTATDKAFNLAREKGIKVQFVLIGYIFQYVPLPECGSPFPRYICACQRRTPRPGRICKILTTCLVESVLVFAVGMLKDLRTSGSALGRHTGLLRRLGRCAPSAGSRAFARSSTRSSLRQRDRENWTRPSTNQ